MATPRKGKAKVKVTADGKSISYGQAGNAKGGGPRLKQLRLKRLALIFLSFSIGCSVYISNKTDIRLYKKNRIIVDTVFVLPLELDTLQTICLVRDGSVLVKNLKNEKTV